MISPKRKKPKKHNNDAAQTTILSKLWGSLSKMWYMRVSKGGVIGRRGHPLWSFFALSDLSPHRTYVSLGMSRINGRYGTGGFGESECWTGRI